MITKTVDNEWFSKSYMDGMTAAQWMEHMRKLNDTNYRCELEKNASSNPEKVHHGGGVHGHKSHAQTANKISTPGIPPSSAVATAADGLPGGKDRTEARQSRALDHFSSKPPVTWRCPKCGAVAVKPPLSSAETSVGGER